MQFKGLQVCLSPLVLLDMLHVCACLLLTYCGAPYCVYTSGTVGNLAKGMTCMQLDLQRIRGGEEYIRENESLKEQIKSQSSYIMSLEQRCNVPPDQRYNPLSSVQVPSTPQHATLNTPGGEW